MPCCPGGEFRDIPGIKAGMAEERQRGSETRFRFLAFKAPQHLRQPDGAVKHTVVLEVDETRQFAFHQGVDMIDHPAPEGHPQHGGDDRAKSAEPFIVEPGNLSVDFAEQGAAGGACDVIKSGETVVPRAGPCSQARRVVRKCEALEGFHERVRRCRFGSDLRHVGKTERAVVVARDGDRLRHGTVRAQQGRDIALLPFRNPELDGTDGPLRTRGTGKDVVARVAVAWKLALGIIGFRRARVELVERLQKGGLSRLVASDEDRDRIEWYPAAVLDVAIVANPKAERLHVWSPGAAARDMRARASPATDEPRVTLAPWRPRRAMASACSWEAPDGLNVRSVNRGRGAPPVMVTSTWPSPTVVKTRMALWPDSESREAVRIRSMRAVKASTISDATPLTSPTSASSVMTGIRWPAPDRLEGFPDARVDTGRRSRRCLPGENPQTLAQRRQFAGFVAQGGKMTVHRLHFPEKGSIVIERPVESRFRNGASKSLAGLSEGIGVRGETLRPHRYRCRRTADDQAPPSGIGGLQRRLAAAASADAEQNPEQRQGTEGGNRAVVIVARDKHPAGALDLQGHGKLLGHAGHPVGGQPLMQLVQGAPFGHQPVCCRDKSRIAVGTHGIKRRGGSGPGEIPVHVLHEHDKVRCLATGRFHRRLPGIDRFRERRIRITDGVDRELSLLQLLLQCIDIPGEVGCKVGNGFKGRHQPRCRLQGPVDSRRPCFLHAIANLRCHHDRIGEHRLAALPCQHVEHTGCGDEKHGNDQGKDSGAPAHCCTSPSCRMAGGLDP